MATMVEIRTALLQSAITTLATAGFPDTALAYENVPFEPRGLTKWAYLVIGTDTDVATLGDVGEDGVNGQLRILLSYQQNTGTAVSLADTETIRGTFKAGYRPHAAVVVKQATLGAGYASDGGWYRTVVAVHFWARIARNG